MKTSIVTMAKDGKEVTLYGAIHIGTPEYYTKLNARADSHDVVLFEGTKKDENDTSTVMLMYHKFAECLGLIVQHREGYKDSDKWVNSDLKLNTLKKYMSEKALKMLHRTPEEIEDIIDKIEEQPIMKTIVLYILKHIPKLAWLASRRDYTLINVRNYRVLLDILHQLEQHDSVAVIYGEGHMPHIRKMLKKLGFSIVHTDGLQYLHS